MSQLVVDLDRLKDVEERLRRVGESLDAAGTRAPEGADFGAAGVAVAVALAVQTEAAALMAAECTVLAGAVGLCGSDMEITDAAQAVEMLTVDAR